MTLASGLIVVTVALLVAAPVAVGAVAVYPYSQSSPPSGASAGASITATSSKPGSEGRAAPAAPTSVGSGGGGEGLGAEYASTPPSSEGPTRRETACVAAGEGNVSPCYGVTPAPAPATPAPAKPGRALPPVNPAALAVSVATRMALSAGTIAASPSAQTAGLTGAASWFWLEPSPATRSTSTSLRGEQVTISASVASVQWSFGDGSQLVAGPGVPYRQEPAPTSAVRHIYQTRCLPGDQGHDPYVLPSCGPDGYRTEAIVLWAIAYHASGPVAASGTLPSRTTATALAYPVSEARAFLAATGGER